MGATRKSSRKKARKKPSRQVMEVRTKSLTFLNRFAMVLLLLLICVAVGVTVFPQLAVLEELEEELRVAQAREAEAEDQLDHRERQLVAFRHDIKFQELKGRDLLDYYLPGETIIRIDRD